MKQFLREQLSNYLGSDELGSLAQEEDGTLTVEIASNAVRANGAPAEVVKRTSKLAAVEKPQNPQEAVWSLFTQSLFGSAEFRYLR